MNASTAPGTKETNRRRSESNCGGDSEPDTGICNLQCRTAKSLPMTAIATERRCDHGKKVGAGLPTRYHLAFYLRPCPSWSPGRSGAYSARTVGGRLPGSRCRAPGTSTSFCQNTKISPSRATSGSTTYGVTSVISGRRLSTLPSIADRAWLPSSYLRPCRSARRADHRQPGQSARPCDASVQPGDAASGSEFRRAQGTVSRHVARRRPPHDPTNRNEITGILGVFGRASAKSPAAVGSCAREDMQSRRRNAATASDNRALQCVLLKIDDSDAWFRAWIIFPMNFQDRTPAIWPFDKLAGLAPQYMARLHENNSV